MSSTHSDSPSVLLVGNFISKKDGTHSVGEELSQKLEEDNFRFRLCSRFGHKALRFVDMVFTCLFHRCDIAVVDIYSGLAFRWAEITTAILRFRNIPMVLNLRGGNLPTYSEGREQRIRAVLDRGTLVTAPSTYLQRAFSSFHRTIDVMPNPVDRCRFAYKHRTQNRGSILWVRAFAKLYNPTLAIKAMVKVRAEFPQATLRMVGSIRDESFDACKRLTQENNLESTISLEGPIPNASLGAVYDEADIFLNTTTIDNTPVTLLEALSCGLGIVSTNVGGVPDLISDGVDGVLVDSDDVSAMAEGILSLLRDDAKLASLSRNANESAQRYAWETMSVRWQETLQALVRQPQ